ncbi:NAD(P)/FAD-dependent oxidoreductase [Providencia vermicola]|uniref:FAD-dependent oxidoreductase n=1 Tax=Providencia vermicola TaxID=333965 RepID=A0AAX3RS22_9GAMM|nr:MULTISPECIES: FAD-dependent oxidoreductase [Providencia]ELX8378610.1 FAD-dependent oxidoreductase [Providencia stuartii]ELX8381254.1 FAD-dependent oxidoreductase [Providencia stuartii]EMD5257817.1 FAD-dependent oxidoreductase [Providencia stuartii]USB36511.1 FAD-dependent oxidoreductase [Providencia vermicola]WFC05442.1 FAD-dependent oxidoreductase [Providencia vermicola]
MKPLIEGGIVIIGGGQAGGWAAKTLRDQGYQGRLSVISDEPHDFYERPPLSKAALVQENTTLSRLFSEEETKALNLTWYRPIRATGIDSEKKQVQLSDGRGLTFDKLLIATGGRPRYLSSAWQSHPRVFALRSWDDGQKLRRALLSAKKIAIIGGGWIGLEVAASARLMGIDVTIFERQERLCQRSVPSSVSNALALRHQQAGVNVITDCGEILLDENTDELCIRCAKRPNQSFDLAVMGIGVELNLELAAQAGLELTHGIVVNGQGQTSHPDIYAAGDVACHPTLSLCLQSWAYAQNQAISTAKAMLNHHSEGFNELAWLWSDQYQDNIQILGVPTSQATQHIQRITPTSEVHFSLNNDNELVQMVAFNDARTIKLGKRWMQNSRQLSPLALADPQFSLMSLK